MTQSWRTTRASRPRSASRPSRCSRPSSSGSATLRREPTTAPCARSSCACNSSGAPRRCVRRGPCTRRAPRCGGCRDAIAWALTRPASAERRAGEAASYSQCRPMRTLRACEVCSRAPAPTRTAPPRAPLVLSRLRRPRGAPGALVLRLRAESKADFQEPILPSRLKVVPRNPIWRNAIWPEARLTRPATPRAAAGRAARRPGRSCVPQPWMVRVLCSQPE
jgi:hypothetical protein